MTDDQLRCAMADLDLIDCAGKLRDLLDEEAFVRREWRKCRNNQSIGDGLRRDVLANDLAHLLRVDKELCQRIARQNLDWPQTAVRMVARIAADCRREVRR